MKELREQTIIVLHDMEIDIRAKRPFYISTYAERINSLIPKPTVWLPCDKCGGSGQLRTCVCCGLPKCPAEGSEDVTYQNGPCTCTDGKVEHYVVWDMSHAEVKSRINVNGSCHEHTWLKGEKHEFILELPDLLDADVRFALGWLEFLLENGKGKHHYSTIPNNKGVLSTGPVVKEGV